MKFSELELLADPGSIKTSFLTDSIVRVGFTIREYEVSAQYDCDNAGLYAVCVSLSDLFKLAGNPAPSTEGTVNAELSGGAL